jgi:hypothetical protein
MKYKFFVYCPDESRLIDKIIRTAAKHEAGIYGNYSHVAYITHGEGNWKTEKGAKPHEGKVGTNTRSKVAKIEMTCDGKAIEQLASDIKAIHPWEQVDIEFIRIEKVL